METSSPVSTLRLDGADVANLGYSALTYKFALRRNNYAFFASRAKTPELAVCQLFDRERDPHRG
ncbi:hypothetical protein XH98_32815 [Bradyrhizobium sp. CCBAU 51745]|nr:hypothetical protein [Bradyrhizobium sp. CCBAU 51745]